MRVGGSTTDPISTANLEGVGGRISVSMLLYLFFYLGVLVAPQSILNSTPKDPDDAENSSISSTNTSKHCVSPIIDPDSATLVLFPQNETEALLSALKQVVDNNRADDGHVAALPPARKKAPNATAETRIVPRAKPDDKYPEWIIVNTSQPWTSLEKGSFREDYLKQPNNNRWHVRALKQSWSETLAQVISLGQLPIATELAEMTLPPGNQPGVARAFLNIHAPQRLGVNFDVIRIVSPKLLAKLIQNMQTSSFNSEGPQGTELPHFKDIRSVMRAFNLLNENEPATLTLIRAAPEEFYNLLNDPQTNGGGTHGDIETFRFRLLVCTPDYLHQLVESCRPNRSRAKLMKYVFADVQTYMCVTRDQFGRIVGDIAAYLSKWEADKFSRNKPRLQQDDFGSDAGPRNLVGDAFREYAMAHYDAVVSALKIISTLPDDDGGRDLNAPIRLPSSDILIPSRRLVGYAAKMVSSSALG